MGLAALDDAEIVARCRQGDDAAWHELVTRYSRYVYAIATQGFRLSQQDADDVFQEVFSRAHQHLDRLRDDEALRPWLRKSARRVCIDLWRERSRETLTGEVEVEAAAADETIERLDEALTVRDALRRLPEHCREILDRFFTGDQSYQTIGAALGIPPGTIASRISRCLARLRSELGTAPLRVSGDIT
jgi:RNA polymerase sigma factor (sigma-70 family)